jgi:hypothetical protein
MDDKELIKRIMEEVKDEKLREELLRRVAMGEGSSVEKILKRIEHRLKAQDSLAKQEIMHGRTEKIAKIEWWGGLIATLSCVLSFAFFYVIFRFIFEDFAEIYKLIFSLGIICLSAFVYSIIQVYYPLEDKKEYERRKKEEKELEK